MNYEEMLVDPSHTNVIPDSCLNFSEMAEHVNLYMNREYFNLMESIGLSEMELMISENTDIIYESDRLENLIDKVKETFAKMFSAIKEFWDKAINKLIVKSDIQVSKHFKPYMVDQLDDTKVYGTTHEFFTIDSLDFGEKAIAFAESLTNKFKSAKESDLSALKKSITEEAYKTISGIDCSSYSEMKKGLKDKLLGKEVSADKAWISSNIKEIKTVLSNDRGSTNKIIRKGYEADKKLFNKIGKQIDKVDNEFTEVLSAWSSTLVSITNCCHCCYSVAMDVYRRQFIEYRNIVIKVVKATKEV